MNRKRAFFIAPGILMAVIALPLGLTVRDVRYAQRNHALLVAIQHKDVQEVGILLRQGADPNTRDTSEPDKPLWNTLLDRLNGRHAPIATGPSALLCALLSEPQFGGSESPQMLAVAATLLQKGASMEADNEDDNSLLSAAVMLKKPQFIRLLLAHGVNHSYLDKNGYDLLEGNARRNNMAMVDLLTDLGFDINHREKITGETPLMVAASLGKTEAVRSLLARHADITLRCRYGTALQLAQHSQNSNAQVIALLRKAEAK